MHTPRRTLGRITAVVAKDAWELIRSLFTLPPGPGPRHGIALRAALSIAIPFGGLTLLGHESLGLQAAAGAFLALFVAGMPARERLKVLPFVAVGLLVSAALGVALTPWPLAFTLGHIVVTIVMSALAYAFRLGPPGPVFFVLLYGLSGNVTSVVDGVRVNAPGPFLLALGGGMLVSYLLAIAPLARSEARQVSARPMRELLPGPWMGRGEIELTCRIAVVAVVGTAVSILLLDPHRAYWTVSAGVAAVGLSSVRRVSIGRGLHRTVGTMVGAVLFVAIAPVGKVAWALVLLLPVLQFLIEQVVVRNYALALVFITPLVLFITEAAVPGVNVDATAWERVLDTAVGSLIATLTVPMHRREPGAAP